MIAISALILPGISGSFILLLMGMYTFIIPTVKSALSTFDTQSLIIVGVFGMGCLVGLATFSRVLSWTFKNYRNPTLALLTGFMIGSLNKLWPWRNVLEYRENSKGDMVPFLEQSVMPSSFEGEAMVIGAIISMIFGFIIVFGLEKLDTSEHE
jgi:putative membrane protein